MKRRSMKKIKFDKQRMLDERLELIKERYRKLILEPRGSARPKFSGEIFLDDEDEFDTYEEAYDLDLVQDIESELI